MTKDAAICIKNSMVDSSLWAPEVEFRVVLGEGQTDGAPYGFEKTRLDRFHGSPPGHRRFGRVVSAGQCRYRMQ
jgi:hypothetical protein